MRKYIFALCISGLAFALKSTAQDTLHFDLKKCAKEHRLEFFNRQLIPLEDQSRSAIGISDGKLEGGAWLKGVEFSDGTIEVDVRGKNVDQRSFLGICFHGRDQDNFDAIYFRPFNFLTHDSVRFTHCIQYASMPGYPWERLRKEFKGQYESSIPQRPDPDSWIHLRIVLNYPDITVYVNDYTEPTLKIHQLSDIRSGKIGLFVGDDSDGDFANLSLQKANLP
jgi:hypothetical protein